MGDIGEIDTGLEWPIKVISGKLLRHLMRKNSIPPRPLQDSSI